MCTTDLHLHLDGSLAPDLVYALFREQKIDVAAQSPEALFPQLAMTKPESLPRFLEKFALPLMVLQQGEAIEQASCRLVQDLGRQGLSYVEIRFAPQLHTQQGLSQRSVVEAFLRGIALGEEEMPSIKARGIVCCMRGDDTLDKNRQTLQIAKAFLKKGIVAIDLAGDESSYPLSLYASLFQEANSLGVPFTIHAGECGAMENISLAMQFGAARIGHGVMAAKEPALLRALAAAQIPLELCPTSNLFTGAIASYQDFPLQAFLQAGVLVTINTDDMTVCNTTLQNEFAILKQYCALTAVQQIQLEENAKKAAFFR